MFDPNLSEEWSELVLGHTASAGETIFWSGTKDAALDG